MAFPGNLPGIIGKAQPAAMALLNYGSFAMKQYAQ